jgi:hypothetical protein
MGSGSIVEFGGCVLIGGAMSFGRGSWYVVLTVIFILAFTWMLFWLSPVPTFVYGHDIFSALDAGWRVTCGQRPNIDFFIGIGPLYALANAMGLFLAGETVSGVGYAGAVITFIIAFWSFWLGKRSLGPGFACVLAVFTAFLVGTTVPIGEPGPFSFSYAMNYTRWAFGLLSVLLVEVLSSDESSFADGISSGVALLLLFFLKINMFIVGFGLLFLSLLLYPTSRRRLAGIALGAFSIILPMMVYLHFSIVPMVRDIWIIARVRAHAASSGTLTEIARDHIVGSIFIVLIAFVTAYRASLSSRKILAFVIMGASVSAAGIFCIATQWQRSGMPLNAVFAFVCLAKSDLLSALAPTKGRASWAHNMAQLACLSAILMFGWPLLWDFTSMGFLAVGKTPKLGALSSFEVATLAPLKSFGIPQAQAVDGPDLVYKINDGLRVLEHSTKSTESIAALDLYNPFTFALHRPPNRGGVSGFLHYGFSFDDADHPAPELFLGTADVVMVPQHPSGLPVQNEAMVRTYQAFLLANFEPSSRSGEWTLWRKKTGTPRNYKAGLK